MKPRKIGIVGCGVIAGSHVRILRRLMPGATIALYDVDYQRAKVFAERWSLKSVYTDMETLLAQERPDTVHIVTPPSTHAVLAEKALLADAHVFVEKPVTESATEYNRLADLAAGKQRILCGDYSTLGMPVVREAVRMVRSGELGKLVAMHCTFAGSEGGGKIQYKDPNHWAYKLRGGILQNMIDHPLSLALSVMDPVEEHHLFVNRRNMLPCDSPDLVHLSLRNQHQVGSLTLSLGHGCNERRAHFILEGGSIVIDMGRQLISCNKGRGPQSFIKKALSGILEGYAYAGGTVRNMVLAACGKLARDPGIAHVMENFYRAIEFGDELTVRAEVLRSMTGLLDEIWDEVDSQCQATIEELPR